jgi:NDP-sugar pyrophosphorylase family protein
LYFTNIPQVAELLNLRRFSVIKVTVLKVGSPNEMEPLTCNCPLHKLNIAGLSIASRLEKMFACENTAVEAELEIRADFIPSQELVQKVCASDKNIIVTREDGSEVIKYTCSAAGNYRKVQADPDCLNLVYPWDVLVANERIIAEISDNKIEGEFSPAANIDGVLHLGKGSVVLPGVYIEGKVIIGENCKIGPNCYIRGNTYIGNNCHIGQAVEIKNSLIMNKVSVGHLSYFGDSIICDNTNIGAGGITANLRHDGTNHRSMVNNQLLDTGRRKFGTVIGEGVHTGIHNSIYPGRKIWPHVYTSPGAVIDRDEKVLCDI